MITRDDITRIEIAYESARSVDGQESARFGEHAVLMGMLQKLGLPAGDVAEAYATCERVLYGGR